MRNTLLSHFSLISIYPLTAAASSRLNKKVEEECPVDDTLDKVVAKEEG